MSAVASRRAFLTGRLPREDDSVKRPPGAARENFHDLCTRCGDCVSVCPEEVLAMDDAGLPVFQPQQGGCTFCGDCADACKTDALSLDRFAEWPWRAKVLKITPTLTLAAAAPGPLATGAGGEGKGEAAQV